jgi:hypothetical protein
LIVLRAFVAGTTGTLPASADVTLDPSGLPCGDGAIGLDDVLMLLRKAVGMSSY